MFIKLTIRDGKQNKSGYTNHPTEYIYKGNYAIEQMLIRQTEIYFGVKVSSQLEEILKTRITNGDDF